MFAAHYFAGRYFPRRYFPAVGAPEVEEPGPADQYSRTSATDYDTTFSRMAIAELPYGRIAQTDFTYLRPAADED